MILKMCACIMLLADVHIVPDIPDLTLAADTNMTIKCYGEVPVTWTLDEFGATKNASTFNYTNIKTITSVLL